MYCSYPVVYLQKRTLQLRHKLNLVTTSHECAHTPKEVPRTAAQTMGDGDAMASTPQLAESVQKDILERSQHAVPAMEVSKAKTLALYSRVRLPLMSTS